MMPDLTKLFDAYNLKARLSPALLVTAPGIIALLILFPDSRTLINSIVSLVATLGILLLMTYLAGAAGRRKQEGLVKLWSGMPTTIALRHQDDTIDPITKKRYHTRLEALVNGVNIPSPDEERSEPQTADYQYQSCVKWLLEQTRDPKKYNLVFESNVSYGFSRNLWALKPWGIFVCIGSFFASLFLIYTQHGYNFQNVLPQQWVPLVVSFVSILIWLIAINPDWVRSHGFAYAKAILGTCDSL